MFGGRFPVFGRNRFGREAEEDIDCTTTGPCDRRAEGMRGRGVCGSDGNTYASVCLMRFISCQHGKRVTLTYNDACDSPCATNPTEVDLQCATNGLTYWNKCAVEEFNYLLGNSQLFVQIAYPGPCMDNRQMANDYVEEYEIAEEEEEEEEIEEDPSDPYSFEKCRQRRQEAEQNPCSPFDHKSCYNDRRQYSFCEFQLAKCDNSKLVLAIDENSC